LKQNEVAPVFAEMQRARNVTKASGKVHCIAHSQRKLTFNLRISQN